MEITIVEQPESPRAGNLVGLAMRAGLAFLAGLALWMLIAQYQGEPGPSVDSLSQAAFEAQTGVRLVRVSLSAGGGMIDLRYQVIDPDKAVIVHDQDNPPTIVDEGTGKTINTPWMDHSRNQELHAGVTYYDLLMNAGGVIKPGSTVIVVIGGARLEHVPVR